jgi:hypothetical protein
MAPQVFAAAARLLAALREQVPLELPAVACPLALPVGAMTGH